MKREPLISVIVPVYKVEKYLNECVRSILAQEYKNLEIILVDDGSPDRCPEMCDAFAKEDGRVRVIHQENVGLSGARNSGLDVASGELIAFVDSDDVTHATMIKRLYEIMVDEDADISEVGFVSFRDGSQPEYAGAQRGKTAVMPGNDVAKEALCEGTNVRWSVWAKLFKAEFFREEKIRFPQGRYFEDVPLTVELACLARRVARCDTALYGYRQREGSIIFATSRDPIWFEKNMNDTQYIREKLCSIIRKRQLPFMDMMESYEVRDTLRLLRDVIYGGSKELRKRYYPFLRGKIMEKKKNALCNPYLSAMRKWEIRLLSIGAAAYVPAVHIICGRNRRI